MNLLREYAYWLTTAQTSSNHYNFVQNVETVRLILHVNIIRLTYIRRGYIRVDEILRIRLYQI